MAMLTAASAARLKTPGRYSAGDGLYLLVKPSGTKSWVARVRVGGRRVDRGLGSFSTTKLSEARRALQVLRADVLHRTVSPARWLKAARPQSTPTLREAAQETWKSLQARWRPYNRHEWWASFERYVFSTLEDRPIDTVTRQDVLGLLVPLYERVPSTGPKVRNRLRSVFRWAMAYGLISFNPAGEAIEAALPVVPQGRHYRALHYSEVGAAMVQVAASRPLRPSHLAFAFTVLTAGRSAEVRGMTWGELSEDGQLWEIPPDRMKSNRRHRVPLSLQAQRVLVRAALDLPGVLYSEEHRGLLIPKPSADALVFPGNNDRRLSESTIRKQLLGLGLDCTLHGFRSSFRDWAAEQSGASHSAIELSLAHAVGTTVEQAYFRSDLLDQRRELMQRWADFCAPTSDRRHLCPPPGHGRIQTVAPDGDGLVSRPMKASA